MALLTADDVLNKKFQATKFREGYDQDEVDDLLDRVVATLRAREAGAPADRPLTAADLDALSFTTTKFREGYAQGDVDALLERVRVQLGAAPTPTPRLAPVDVASPVVVEEKSGFWRRLFGG